MCGRADPQRLYNTVGAVAEGGENVNNEVNDTVVASCCWDGRGLFLPVNWESDRGLNSGWDSGIRGEGAKQ